MRRWKQADLAARGGVDEGSPSWIGEPVERVVAEEEIESPACERDPSTADREIVRRRDLKPRAGQRFTRRARLGAELVGIFGRVESADQAHGERTVRGAAAERPLAPAPPARGQSGPEAG